MQTQSENKCCVICGKQIESRGNNPAPVKNEGQCCDECNINIVIPARLRLRNYNGKPILLYFPSRNGPNFLRIEEGTGDNLLQEDKENGYVDYVNWESYSISLDSCPPEFIEDDGGMVLTNRYVREMSVDEIERLVKEQCDLLDEEAIYIHDVS